VSNIGDTVTVSKVNGSNEPTQFGTDYMACSPNVVSASKTVPANCTAVVQRKLTINSGVKLTISSGAYLLIH
jgi:hypothetical protein